MHETMIQSSKSIYGRSNFSIGSVYNFGIPKPDVTGMSKTSFQTLTRIDNLLLLKDFLDCIEQVKSV